MLGKSFSEPRAGPFEPGAGIGVGTFFTSGIAEVGGLPVFLSWLFGILDFRQALWMLVAIAGIAAAPTIVTAIWGA